MKTLIFICSLIFFSSGMFSQEANSVQIPSTAPNFNLPDANGNRVELGELCKNSLCIVYFYPKASTPGCTKEACNFRDNLSALQEKNVQVVGISVDPVSAIREFSKEHSLNFPLLSDADGSVTKQFGVLNQNGRAQRITFIIGQDLRILDVIRNVDVTTHANDLLERIKALIPER